MRGEQADGAVEGDDCTGQGEYGWWQWQWLSQRQRQRQRQQQRQLQRQRQRQRQRQQQRQRRGARASVCGDKDGRVWHLALPKDQTVEKQRRRWQWHSCGLLVNRHTAAAAAVHNCHAAHRVRCC